MVYVHIPHETRTSRNQESGPSDTPTHRGHVICGTTAFVAVLAIFTVAYLPLVVTLRELLGVLSTTALVWLFVAFWTVVWLVLDVFWIRAVSRVSTGLR